MVHMQSQVATAADVQASSRSLLPEPGDMDQKKKHPLSLVLTKYISKRTHIAGHGGIHL